MNTNRKEQYSASELLAILEQNPKAWENTSNIFSGKIWRLPQDKDMDRALAMFKASLGLTEQKEKFINQLN